MCKDVMCKDKLSMKREADKAIVRKKRDFISYIPEYTIPKLQEAYEDDASRAMGYFKSRYNK